MGQRLGLTYQQIQKYETGANTMSAGRLYMIAQLLNVPIAFFFGEGEHEEAGDLFGDGLADGRDGLSREIAELNRAWLRLKDERLRSVLHGLMKILAEEELDPETQAKIESELQAMRAAAKADKDDPDDEEGEDGK